MDYKTVKSYWLISNMTESYTTLNLYHHYLNELRDYVLGNIADTKTNTHYRHTIASHFRSTAIHELSLMHPLHYLFNEDTMCQLVEDIDAYLRDPSTDKKIKPVKLILDLKDIFPMVIKRTSFGEVHLSIGSKYGSFEINSDGSDIQLTDRLVYAKRSATEWKLLVQRQVPFSVQS